MTTHILVVDHSAVSGAVITRILGEVLEEGVVTLCATGAEALQATRQTHYSLIITTLVLADMDGLDLCRRIRSDGRHHLSPVVVISTHADARLLREGFAAGVTDYFDQTRGYRAFGPFIKNVYQLHSTLRGRVLYVEDSRTAAAVTQRVLEKYGLEVRHIESAEQTEGLLRQAEQQGRGYDLVITDFNLKGRMSGGDLLHQLRAHMHYTQQELPVLVVTADEEVQTQSEVFQAGANDFVTKPIIEEILMARVRLLLLIKHQFDALRDQAETMRQMAITDSLTGVCNRRYLLEHGGELLEPANGPVWAMLIDLDHFKHINDTYGHLTGDQVLMATGRLLRENFPDGMAVRFGGEEFAVLLPQREQSQAVRRADGLRQQMEALRPDGVPVTISIGLASSAHQRGNDLNRLLARADEALYAAKAAGRNVVRVSPQAEADPLQHGRRAP